MTARSHCRVAAAAAFVPDRFISQFAHATARAFRKVAVFTRLSAITPRPTQRAAGASAPKAASVCSNDATVCDAVAITVSTAPPGRVAYEVEFSDDEGKTYAELALALDQLLVLHHRPQRAAHGSTARPAPA